MTILGATFLWLCLSEGLCIPSSFRPWSAMLDLSRWEMVQHFRDGWRVARDGRFPDVAHAELVGTGAWSFSAPSDAGAVIQVKVRFTRIGQRLVLRCNDRELATLVAARPGVVRRWMDMPFLRSGPNQLTLSNDDAETPILVEKVLVTNVRRTYPRLAGALLPDLTIPKYRLLQDPTIWWGVIVTLGGTLILGAMSYASIAPEMFPLGWLWGGLIPLVGIFVGNLVTPYALRFSPNTLIMWWAILWGIACLSAVLRWGIRRISRIPMPKLRLAIPRYAARPRGTSAPAPRRCFPEGRQLLRVGHQLLQWGYRLLRGTAVVGQGFVLTLGDWSKALLRWRWSRWGALAVVLLTAWGARTLCYMEHPWIPLEGIGTGNESSGYLHNALRIARVNMFPQGLWDPRLWSDLMGGWNFATILALTLGGFIHCWGFYPGYEYWVWTIIGLSSVLCLAPYGWERVWGYPGLGGIVVGFLWAVSPLMQQYASGIMTDQLGLVLLGLTIWWLGRLAVFERWSEAIAASICLTLLILTRAGMLILMPALLAGLGLAWWRKRGDATKRAAAPRGHLWWGALLGTALLLSIVDRTCLSFNGDIPYLFSMIEGAFRWVAIDRPAVRGTWVVPQGFMTYAGVVWQDQRLWIYAVPAILLVAVAVIWRRRAAAAPLLLVLVPWAWYLVMLLYSPGQARYVLPWLLLEGFLLAQIFDLLWLAIDRWCSGIQRANWRAAVGGALAMITIGLFLYPAATISVQLWNRWGTFQSAQQQRLAYLNWVKSQLPPKAVVIAGSHADPWAITRAVGRPVVYPVSTLHTHPLWSATAKLARHPFVPARAGAGVPLYGCLEPASTRIFEHYHQLGYTMWMLDPLSDPDSVRSLQSSSPGSLGDYAAGCYEAQAYAQRTVGAHSQALYQVIRTPVAERTYQEGVRRGLLPPPGSEILGYGSLSSPEAGPEEGG